MSNGDPIIIKGGGSIEIQLSKDTFPPDAPDSSRHYNANRRITSVTITDDSAETSEEIAIPESGKFTIEIHHSL
ncbi:MAG TPA: hypothetical protein VN643_16530 [Pyrinomonadaceae bacterium]|nr:hypothetical protein [Pyrinomonadaceae bacterium]